MSTVIALHDHRETRRGDGTPQVRRSREHLRVVPVAPDTEAPLRLTRRGRAVVRGAVLALTLLAIVAGVLLLTRPAQADPAGTPLPVGHHVVLPGETLWQIAGEVAPGADRRDTVDALIEFNALESSSVTPGQRLAIPASR